MDCNRFIKHPSIALRFAGVKTDSAADSWKRILLPDQIPGPFKISLCYLLYECNDIISRRTSGTARGCLIFVKRTLCPPRSRLIPVHMPKRDRDFRHLRDTLENKLLGHFGIPHKPNRFRKMHRAERIASKIPNHKFQMTREIYSRIWMIGIYLKFGARDLLLPYCYAPCYAT